MAKSNRGNTAKLERALRKLGQQKGRGRVGGGLRQGRVPYGSTSANPGLDQMRSTTKGESGKTGHTSHLGSIRIRIDITLDGYEEQERKLRVISEQLNEGLIELTMAGALQIVSIIAERGRVNKIGGYEYIKFGGAGTPRAVMKEVMKFAQEIGTEGGDKNIVHNKGAAAQFENVILPMIKRFKPRKLSGAGRKTQRLGIISLAELGTVQIGDVVPQTFPREQFKEGMDSSDLGEGLADRFEPGSGANATGQLSGNVSTGGRSDYTETWQIVEFGTGIYADHPFWGWGPRLTGASKGKSPPLSGTGPWASQGAWWLDPTVVVLGQEGSHFLDNPRGGYTFASQELRGAMDAIKLYFGSKIKG